MNASPNDTVEFAVRVTANGNSSVDNVRVSDSLPAGLNFVGGSTTVDGSQRGDIVNGDLNLGTLSMGQTATIRFRTVAANENNFVFGTTTLINRAVANGDNVNTVSDVAYVNVSRVMAVQNIQLNVSKFGRNITRGETGELSSITAYPNDTVEFIIHVRSFSASRLSNVILQDIFPAGVSYIPRTTSLNGIVIENDSIASGLNIGYLDPNQEAIVRISAKMGPAGSFAAGVSSLINTIQARVDNITVSAQLPITVINQIQLPVSQIAKKVETGYETLLMSALLSVMLSAGFAAYGRTYKARKKKILSMVEKERGDTQNVNFL